MLSGRPTPSPLHPAHQAGSRLCRAPRSCIRRRFLRPSSTRKTLAPIRTKHSCEQVRPKAWTPPFARCMRPGAYTHDPAGDREPAINYGESRFCRSDPSECQVIQTSSRWHICCTSADGGGHRAPVREFLRVCLGLRIAPQFTRSPGPIRRANLVVHGCAAAFAGGRRQHPYREESGARPAHNRRRQVKQNTEHSPVHNSAHQHNTKYPRTNTLSSHRASCE